MRVDDDGVVERDVADPWEPVHRVQAKRRGSRGRVRRQERTS